MLTALPMWVDIDVGVRVWGRSLSSFFRSTRSCGPQHPAVNREVVPRLPFLQITLVYYFRTWELISYHLASGLTGFSFCLC